MFDIRDADDAPLTAIGLALGPFRRLVKDYQMLVDSHIKAVRGRPRGSAFRPSTWAAAACTTKARS